MSNRDQDDNFDEDVIDGFGHEWETFDYVETETAEALDAQFAAYCAPLDISQFNPATAIAGDLGAGSGRWSSRLVPHFCLIYALEPSRGASKVLREKFVDEPKIVVLQETLGMNSIPVESLDLAMSLGVLHHIPDTGLAIRDVASKIKSGGTFLCYLYYKLENKPAFYRGLFWASNLLRWVISRLPYAMRRFIAQIIAGAIYFPLAHASRVLGNRGKDVSNFPLHHYANMPFIMLQNDALDRFGTKLEKRFSKNEIVEMLDEAGFDLTTLRFSEKEPFWTFSVIKI